MTTVTLDSNNLPAILADAGVVVEPEGKEQPGAQVASGEQSSDKGTQDGKPSGADGKPDSQVQTDDEDENGLTAEEREGLTEKMRRTIGKRHRMMREAEEFAAAQFNEKRLLEQRARELEQELARLKGAKPSEQPQAAAAPVKPQRQNFATEGEFLDAMIQWGVDQRLAEQREREAKEAQERRQAEIVQTAQSRIARAREIVPDFDEVVGGADMEVPPVVAGYMQKSEMFAELGYHLAKNPDVLVSLTKLAPDEQLVKIGRIESTLQPFEPKAKPGADNDTTSRQSQTNGKPSSAAPSDTATGAASPSKARGNAAPVITPLDGAGSAGFAKDASDMNIRETIQDWSRKNRVNFDVRKRH